MNEEKVITIEGEEGDTMLRATKLGEGERACLAFEFLGWNKSDACVFQETYIVPWDCVTNSWILEKYSNWLLDRQKYLLSFLVQI